MSEIKHDDLEEFGSGIFDYVAEIPPEKVEMREVT
jgi:hypothetical protein